MVSTLSIPLPSGSPALAGHDDEDIDDGSHYGNRNGNRFLVPRHNVLLSPADVFRLP